MAVTLDLADIQGNILSAYGKLGFPRGRVILLHIGRQADDQNRHFEEDMAAGRNFVTNLLPRITTALRWPSQKKPGLSSHPEVQRPDVAINIGFTWYGLLALGVPTRTLRGMPDEFIDGMARRASMLGDNFPDTPNDYSFLQTWDKVWRHGLDIGPNDDRVHVMVTLNAQMKPDSGEDPLDAATSAIMTMVDGTSVRLLAGHDRHDDVPYQTLSALFEGGAPSPKEHFGYTDAIGDPVFEGQYLNGEENDYKVGNGAVDGSGTWRPLATGEFLLGYPDEAQEIPGATMPLDFSRNGTFVAYRKLHQNVASFRDYVTRTATDFGVVFGKLAQADAEDLLKAKIAGRWADGVPLATAPTQADWEAFNAKYPEVDPYKDPHGFATRNHAQRDFLYAPDPEGTRCPLTSHLRRINTRDMLDPEATQAKAANRGGSVLNNRRRILRRGLPYGTSPAGTRDDDEHGIVMLVTCASLFRQFEFVQQQWLNYGLDSRAGNDTCPLVGNHAQPGGRLPPAKFVIAADASAGHPPFVATRLPQFVEMRGGDYFFIPSMTALRMIGMGVVDPT